MKKAFWLVCLLCSCALFALGNRPAAEPAADLLGTYWRLTEVAGQEITASGVQGREAHLILKKADRSVSGSGGVNRLISKYTLGENNALSFVSPASTMMAGLPEAMDTENKFFQALNQTKKYTITGRQLTLLDEKDRTLAVLTAIEQ